MSLNHSFSIQYARDYGIEEAIMIHHFQYWIEHNRMLKKNFIKGRTWMYQSQKEIAAHFCYLNEEKVFYAIKKLVDKGVLITGNFHKNRFTKTLWYAFKNEEKFTIPENSPIDTKKSRNREGNIPHSLYTDAKTDAKKEQQQGVAPLKPAVVVSSSKKEIYPCLQDFDETIVPLQQKERLTKLYTEEIVSNAIAAIVEQGAPESFSKSLNAACKGKWVLSAKVSIETQESNHQWISKIITNIDYSSCKKRGFEFHIGPSYFEVAYNSQKASDHYKFSDKNFRKLVTEKLTDLKLTKK